jgi:hypothetical protein
VVATSALSARQVVTPVEVLIGVGWLNAADVEAWRGGRVPYLERVWSLVEAARAQHTTVSAVLAAMAGSAVVAATRAAGTTAESTMAPVQRYA